MSVRLSVCPGPVLEQNVLEEGESRLSQAMPIGKFSRGLIGLPPENHHDICSEPVPGQIVLFSCCCSCLSQHSHKYIHRGGELWNGTPLPNRLGGLGERRKLPQPAENEFGAFQL